MKKKHRQQHKKITQTHSTFDDDMNWLMMENDNNNSDNDSDPHSRHSNIRLLFFDAPSHNRHTVTHQSQASRAFDSLIGTNSTHSMSKSRLPMNAERKTYDGYEEIHVPPVKNKVLDNDAALSLVKIASLPEFARGCFKGYRTLNRIQSRIYHTAMFKDENVLVCAPTGTMNKQQ